MRRKSTRKLSLTARATDPDSEGKTSKIIPPLTSLTSKSSGRLQRRAALTDLIT